MPAADSPGDRLRVVLAEALEPEGVAVLDAEPGLEVVDVSPGGREVLFEALERAAGLIVRGGTTVDEVLLRAAPALRVVGRAGVGVDNIDLGAAARRGVAVMNAPSGNTCSTAELTFGLLLAAARHIARADRSVRAGEWDRKALRGSQLHGRALGVVGAGRIGSAVLAVGRAFGMGLLACDPYLTPHRMEEIGAEFLEFRALLERADVVSFHVPLTAETDGMLGEAELARMKPGAFLVNASRGGVVDERAVARALIEGRLAGAGLDVFAEEPLPAGSPLREAPNLVTTPHLGGATDEAKRAVAIEVATSVRDALLGAELGPALNL
ncbi:MAG: hydroxyacid dehydrogenase [Candidatus Palauibacterales bacterium]|nr:hydroxyacid dehydrogenase [Candidatus Palauibacterales bacterium]MDP2583602.1 hydroxyacid dehydrogenase [Candidatus Palauibacterales bacterium]